MPMLVRIAAISRRGLVPILSVCHSLELQRWHDIPFTLRRLILLFWFGLRRLFTPLWLTRFANLDYRARRWEGLREDLRGRRWVEHYEFLSTGTSCVENVSEEEMEKMITIESLSWGYKGAEFNENWQCQFPILIDHQ
jgi:hypothetical protein